MTIVCAVAGKDGIWIGSDTSADDGSRVFDVGRKFITGKGWAIGGAGFLRSIYLMQRNAKGLLSLRCPYKIADTLRELHDTDDFRKEEGSGPVAYPCQFVICSVDAIWEVGTTFEALPVEFAVIGSASQYGLGAIDALRRPAHLKVSTKEIVYSAVAAAVCFSPSCGGNVMVEKVK